MTRATARSAAADQTSILHDTALIEDLRLQMLKFATLQLKDAALAEDTVQESVRGRAQERGLVAWPGGAAHARHDVFRLSELRQATERAQAGGAGLRQGQGMIRGAVSVEAMAAIVLESTLTCCSRAR